MRKPGNPSGVTFRLTLARMADALHSNGEVEEAILPAGTEVRVVSDAPCPPAPDVHCYEIDVDGSRYVIVANHLEAACEPV